MQDTNKRPIVLCGLGRMGARVLEYLRAARMPVVVVDNQCQPEDERLRGENIGLVQGDCRDRGVLVRAGVGEAQGVLVLTSDDLLNITTTLVVRSLNPGVRVVLRMFDQDLIGRLGRAIDNVFALSTAMLTAPILAMTAMTGQAIGAFRVERQPPDSSPATEDAPLAAKGKGTPEEPESVGYLVAEVMVEAGSDLHGRSIEELRAYRDVAVLGHLTGPAAAGVATVSWRRTMRATRPVEEFDEPRKGDDTANPVRLLQELDPKARLKAGDVLILCGEPRALSPLLANAEDESVPHLIWAHWLRRWGRVAWRSLSEIDRPLLIATTVLIVVVLVSTLVLHFGNRKYTWAEALFRTVGVMATMTGMPPPDELVDPTDPEAADRGAYLEVYVAGLRLVGATLLAVFTAIVTNYLLRARMSGALEVRRIPEGGHILVCGLGSIGYLVVEELVRYDERVVVIERDPANRFVTTARRLGVPVIAGDAGVHEVMRQAHASEAAAVIATTSNDLINLAVALQAREANPTQRVVLLMNDPELARMLREGASVELAVSVPKLAAPAFLAGLFGDRVQTVFMVRRHLLAVIDLVLHEDDPLLGRSVRAVAIDYNLQPIAVFSAERPRLSGSTWGSQPPGQAKRTPPTGETPTEPAKRLGPKDRLVAVIKLQDLERLLRREPAPASCAVEVGGFPLPAKEWMVGLIREFQQVSPAEAESVSEQLPFRLADRVTRGQAEDLLSQLVAARVTAYLTADTDAKVGE